MAMIAITQCGERMGIENARSGFLSTVQMWFGTQYMQHANCFEFRSGYPQGVPPVAPEYGLVRVSEYPQDSIQGIYSGYILYMAKNGAIYRTPTPLVGVWEDGTERFGLVRFGTKNGYSYVLQATFNLSGTTDMICMQGTYSQQIRITANLGYGMALDGQRPEDSGFTVVPGLPQQIEPNPMLGLCLYFWYDGRILRTDPIVS